MEGGEADHYAALGVSRGAGAEEVKAAFRAAAKKHHPDMGGDEARFKRISVAYEVLSDATERRTYDAANPFAGVVFGGGGGGGGDGRHARGGHMGVRGWAAGSGGGVGGGGVAPGETPFDIDEWARMQFGPTSTQREWATAQRVREAQATGFASFNRGDDNAGINWEARRAAREAVRGWADPGASETQYYRRFASDYRSAQASAARRWPVALLLWLAVGGVVWGAANRIASSR